jgi:hypothetical protein
MLLPANRQHQERFLPEKEINFTSLAQRRVYVGEFFEEATEKLLHAERLMTNTKADICPDLHRGNTFFEVKSIGASNELVLRKESHERELEFCKDHDLYYVLWSHFCAVSLCADKTTLRQELAKELRDVVIVPASLIHKVCHGRPTFQWSRYKDSAVKDVGYRMKLKEIIQALGSVQETILWELQVGEHHIGPATIHCPPNFSIRR